MPNTYHQSPFAHTTPSASPTPNHPASPTVTDLKAQLDPTLAKLLDQDKAHLETTKLPIITVSASFKEDLKGWYCLPENEQLPDVVLSRAHHSMALAIASLAWGKSLDKDKAWIFDPTNYVGRADWKKIQFTELVGKTLARRPLLKKVKDIIDKYGRSKLPILSSIEPPLRGVTKHVRQPILSLHIAAGNILLEAGHTVFQVVTDPHVRADYLTHADSPQMFFAVFDHKTRTDFLEQAELMGKKVDPRRVIVTGPPVDPRILAARHGKRAWKPNTPLRLCLTTGGLGTNKPEITTIFEQLLPWLRAQSPDQPKIQLIIYASTHRDIRRHILDLAHNYQINTGSFGDENSRLRVLYHPQIVDANELLVRYAFTWADLFITKPSGDMAYDAAAAGCGLLTLQEWGEWEHNIRNIFELREISRRAQPHQIRQQLALLMTPQPTSNSSAHTAEHSSWITQAMQKTKSLEPLFTQGAQNIVREYQKLTSTS